MESDAPANLFNDYNSSSHTRFAVGGAEGGEELVKKVSVCEGGNGGDDCSQKFPAARGAMGDGDGSACAGGEGGHFQQDGHEHTAVDSSGLSVPKTGLVSRMVTYSAQFDVSSPGSAHSAHNAVALSCEDGTFTKRRRSKSYSPTGSRSILHRPKVSRRLSRSMDSIKPEFLAAEFYQGVNIQMQASTGENKEVESDRNRMEEEDDDGGDEEEELRELEQVGRVSVLPRVLSSCLAFLYFFVS